MPLVKGHQIVTDEFVTITGDDDIPERGAILVSAERFLESGIHEER